MIDVSHLTKTYNGNVQALRGVDLTIGTGMFGLLGPNGAGKTTLMRIMAGLVRPTSGSVNVLGNDVTTEAGKQASKAQLGYLPQELGPTPTSPPPNFSTILLSSKVSPMPNAVVNKLPRCWKRCV
jgi:ABC-type multidrug transport system ATPase subunit